MTATVRDWQTAGVDIAVELATAGDLFYGYTQQAYPFQTGGPGGAPLGWTQTVSAGTATTDFNWTTQDAVFSLSTKNIVGTFQYAEIQLIVSVLPSRKYQLLAQQRRIEGYPVTSAYQIRLDVFTGGSWQQKFVADTKAGDNWSPVALTSSIAIPADCTQARICLRARGTDPSALFGTQFTNVFMMLESTTPTPFVWRDITCDVRELAVRYGREKFTNRYDVSTLEVGLLNDSGDYTFRDPHPLNLAPGSVVRVTATHNTITYPLAFHVVDTMIEDYTLDGHALAVWHCLDPTSTYADKNTGAGQSVTRTSGARVGELLDQVGYITRTLDTGQFITQSIEGSNQPIRDSIGVTADSEGGAFFAGRDGSMVYKDRTWPTVDVNLSQVTANLSAFPHSRGPLPPAVDQVPDRPGAPTICVAELVTDWSMDRVVNIVHLANANGSQQTFIDTTSLKTYGPRTYQRNDFVLAPVATPNLAVRANDIMAGYAKPVLRVNGTEFNATAAGSWPWVLAVFLNWLVRVWYTHPTAGWGYEVTTHIQSVQHRITPDDWTVRLSVDQPYTFVPFQRSDVGWDAGRWDSAKWDETVLT